MVLTMAAVAANKGIRTEDLSVEVDYQVDQEPLKSHAVFRSRIYLGEGLTPRERAILFNSARHCEVQKLLAGEIEFVDELVVE